MTLQSREATIETSIDNRQCRRHRLMLEIEARDSGPTSSPVTVYDISSTGVLIETNSSLSVGEMIEVKLPRVGFQMAEIVWTSGELVGCKFTHALTQGAVSAARLGGNQAQFDEASRVLPYLSTLHQANEQESANANQEKLPFGLTLRVILSLAVLSWATVKLVAVALIA